MKPGLIGVVCQDAARFSNFAASLTALSVPHGTAIKWIMGHQVASSRNELVRDFLAAERLEWLFMLDDDHAFAEDLLLRLLSHDVDIVMPICLTRAPPYLPTIFSGWADTDETLRQRLDLNDHPGGGLVRVHSGGAAGMLIQRHVLEAIDEPWFRSGQLSHVEMGEDVGFCDRARYYGCELFCDLDAPLGHSTVATVWPTRQPDGWTYGWSFPGGAEIAMPIGSWGVTA